MKNINCMNVCLGNQLLTEVDKYAKKSGLHRDAAIQKLIQIIENENKNYEIINGQQYVTLRVPVTTEYTVTWAKNDQS